MGEFKFKEIITSDKDIEQKNSFFIRSIINYFVCLVTIAVTMFIL